MKNIVQNLLLWSLMSTLAMSYEVTNIGNANTMICSYSYKYNNGTKIILPEFERTISRMKVRNNGRTIIAPKGTKYTYKSVKDDGSMNYRSTNNKYLMVVYPTKRGQSVSGSMHNYTDILVGKAGSKSFASGSCRLEVN